MSTNQVKRLITFEILLNPSSGISDRCINLSDEIERIAGVTKKTIVTAYGDAYGDSLCDINNRLYIFNNFLMNHCTWHNMVFTHYIYEINK